MDQVRFSSNDFEHELRLPDSYIYWVLSSQKPAFSLPDDQLLKNSHDEAAVMTQTLTTHWDPSFKALFEMQDVEQTSVLKIDNMKPDLPKWETQGVTLLGDGVHAMSPTVGIGAVTALRMWGEFGEGFG